MAKISIIQGPNLNLLGTREPELYGHFTLQGIHDELENSFGKENTLSFFQSNHEGAIIEAIQECSTQDGVILNPAAFTHSSYAIRDAILAIEKPVVEVHLTNPYAREDFRRKSVIAPVCIAQICGFGGFGYLLAMRGLLDRLA